MWTKVPRDVDDDDVTARRWSSLPLNERHGSADHGGNPSTATAEDLQLQRLGGSMIDVCRNATTTSKTVETGDKFVEEGYDGDGELDNCLSVSPRLQPLKRRLLEPQRERFLTAYERLSYELASDKRCLREITLGKRVGFYQLRNQIGSGNFSTVKLGVHILTRGQ